MRSDVRLITLCALAGLALGGCDTASTDTDDDTDTGATETDVTCEDVEIPYNGVDDDCDPGTLDDDLDQDGDLKAVDCDDADPTRGPSATDIGWDGIDQDCDGADLDATPDTPSLSISLDLSADVDQLALATAAAHALVVARPSDAAAELALDGVVADLTTGAVTALSIATPDASHAVHDVAVWPRAGGFGVLFAFDDRDDGGCNLYAVPVGLDGTQGTVRRITDPATAFSGCDLGVTAIELDGSDHILHLQPQRYLENDGVGNPQIVRRVVDIDDGTTIDEKGYGVFQGGGPWIRQAIPFGDDALLTYVFAGSANTKIARFDADGLSDNQSNARIYGGLTSMLAGPALPVSAVSNQREDGTTGSRTVTLLRSYPGAVSNNPTLEWAQARITPGATVGDDPVVDVTVGGPDAPTVLGEVETLLGRAFVVADADGAYRAVWTEGGELRSTRTTTDEAVTGDDRLAGESVTLLDTAQRGARIAWLVAVGGPGTATLRLVTSAR